jgi:hypothetical protein
VKPIVESYIVSVWNSLEQDTLSPLLFNFAIQYANKRSKVKHEGLKLNAARQLWVYANDIYLLGRNINAIKRNESVLNVSKR